MKKTVGIIRIAVLTSLLVACTMSLFARHNDPENTVLQSRHYCLSDPGYIGILGAQHNCYTDPTYAFQIIK